MKRGKLIVIEGNEGVGKSLQSKHLRDKMESLNIPTYLTSECTKGPIGRVIRDDYLSGKRIADRRLINYLYAADRLDHITNTEDGLLSMIDDGINVITDRYYMSSLALYSQEFLNTSEYEKEMEFIYSLNLTARSLLKPDITVVIEVPSEEIIKRMKGRQEKIEIYDVDDITPRTNQAYKDSINFLREKGDNIVQVDGLGSTWKVHDRIWSVVEPILREV